MRIVILILLFIHSCSTASSQEADTLKTLSNSIRSIDPDDDDFSDLLFLKEKIGNSRIVVLGENTHSDGETDKAKVRMVKFLHEYMGFDVIAWEFNYSMDLYINEKFKADSAVTSYYGY